MKMFTAISMLTFGLSAAAMAADVKGFVEDSACASKAGMKGNAKCAQTCISKGDSAVLVTPEGKVYKIANQDKITAHAGHNVTITGDVKDDTITVESVAMNQ